MEKWTYLGRLREFYSINQIQMRMRGVGVKNYETFLDIISGSSLSRFLPRPFCSSVRNNGDVPQRSVRE